MLHNTLKEIPLAHNPQMIFKSTAFLSNMPKYSSMHFPKDAYLEITEFFKHFDTPNFSTSFTFFEILSRYSWSLTMAKHLLTLAFFSHQLQKKRYMNSGIRSRKLPFIVIANPLFRTTWILVVSCTKESYFIQDRLSFIFLFSWFFFLTFACCWCLLHIIINVNVTLYLTNYNPNVISCRSIVIFTKWHLRNWRKITQV